MSLFQKLNHIWSSNKRLIPFFKHSFLHHSSISIHFISSASFSARTYNLPRIYFSQHPWRLRLHGDGHRNRSVGGEGVCVIEGEIHLPQEPGRISEPRASRPSAHPESERLVSQRLEEQQQPALLLQGSCPQSFTASVRCWTSLNCSKTRNVSCSQSHVYKGFLNY